MSSVQTQTKWTLDPAHTIMEFAVKHMMISTVKGRFASVEGELVGDPTDLKTAEVRVVIEAAGVDTREADRDGHLRSADFFDVENHPHLTFKSRNITATSEAGVYNMEGDLTIRDVTRPVSLTITLEGTGKDPWGNQRAGFSASGTIDRKDFGLTWNTVLEAGGVLVGDQVKISLDVQVVRQD